MPGLPALSNPDPELDSKLGADQVRARKPIARSDAEWETFTLGRYVISGRIASGGMATVYRARLEGQGGFAREFALKVIHPHLASAEGFKDRFLDEARVASRVNHPNVVATVDSDQDRGYHFLVLELVDGVTVRQLQVHDLHRSPTSEGARLSPAEAARIIADVARGLHAVHTVVDERGESLDVVHRDLSPHNLMLDVTGRAVLIDLGLVKARGQLGHTQTGVLCGKLPYMSPEQSRMEPLDARSDVFSLGSVLFELAVGEAPFGDDHTPGTLDALRTCDADRLAVKLVDANVPSWLTQVVLTCLRRDPDDRYASAASLADALDEAMRRAGVVQTAARQSLARRVQAIHHQVDPVQPAEPLPPLISSDPTGSHRALGRGRLSALPGWARGLAMATAGALVGLTSLFAIDALRSSKSSATASDQSWIPSLAADANLDDAATTPVPRLVEPAPELDDASARERRRAPLPSADEQEPTPEVPRKRKASTPRKQDDSGEFKGNPYD